MTARTPFMPLFVGDLLAATPAWEGEERALYVLLLAYQWTSGPLPADTRRLARMCQYDPANFAELWKTVGPKFPEVEGGRANPRLEQHRQQVARISAKKAQSGRAGAAARWKQDGERHAPAIAKPIADAISLQCHPIQSNPIQSNLPSYSESASSGGATFHVEPTGEAPTFTDFREGYPNFAGRQDWITAEHYWRIRLDEGCSTRDLVAATRRYRAFCEGGGVSGTKYVMSPVKFLSAPDKPWEQRWSLPEPVTAAQPARESDYDRIKRLTHERASQEATTIVAGGEEP